jgi:sugar lactone lactonase YvrE
MASTAPQLHASLDWVNAAPQSIPGQRGRVIALVFWNAGSAYCHNLLDQLRLLRARYPETLAVLGIHLPKFDAEVDGETVRKAANRLRVAFPVANDRAWVTWQHYGITRWPSVALIDTRGNLREVLSGDDQFAALDTGIATLLTEAGNHAQLPHDEESLHGAEPRLPLAFPSGLAATDNHLYIADTAHHRIIECTFEGRVLRQFGNGHPALVDGPPNESAFSFPRGLCLTRDALYVADAGNHAVRRIQLLDGSAQTVIGTGRAGAPKEGRYMQTGELGIADGPGRNALLAHPAGLALVQQTLYVADSASSAVRAIALQQATVQTLVGQGLYEFGDADGPRGAARLQHPLALALDPGAPVLWIADAYNGSLRKLRLGGGDVTTHPLPHTLVQPSAIAFGAGAMWIADQATHEVYRHDPNTGVLARVPVGE